MLSHMLLRKKWFFIRSTLLKTYPFLRTSISFFCCCICICICEAFKSKMWLSSPSHCSRYSHFFPTDRVTPSFKGRSESTWLKTQERELWIQLCDGRNAKNPRVVWFLLSQMKVTLSFEERSKGAWLQTWGVWHWKIVTSQGDINNEITLKPLKTLSMNEDKIDWKVCRLLALPL